MSPFLWFHYFLKGKKKRITFSNGMLKNVKYWIYTRKSVSLVLILPCVFCLILGVGAILIPIQIMLVNLNYFLNA